MEPEFRKWMRLLEKEYLHGTDAIFDAFVIPQQGKNGDMFGPAVYVTNDPDYADKFGKTILRVEVSSDQFINVDVRMPRDQRFHGLHVFNGITAEHHVKVYMQ